CNRFRFQSHALKVGRFPHVSGFWIPLEDVTFRGIKLLPPLIAIKNRRVFFIEHFGINGSIDDLLNFGGVWPNITEKYIVAFAILAQWFVFEVEVHGASQGIGNNQRRRRRSEERRVGKACADRRMADRGEYTDGRDRAVV